MKTVGVLCGYSKSGVVTVDSDGSGGVRVLYRGSVTTDSRDEDGHRRRFIAEELAKHVKEMGPEFVWIGSAGLGSSSSKSQALIYTVQGALFTVAKRVKLFDHSTFGDEPEREAVRNFGQRIGRNREEDLAAALAIYGLKRGNFNALLSEPRKAI